MATESIFELKRDFSSLKEKMIVHHTLVSSLVKHRNTDLFEKWKAVNHKQLMRLATGDDDSYYALVELINDKENSIDIELDLLMYYKNKGYSKFNPLVSLRRLRDDIKAARKELVTAKKDTDDYLTELQEIKAKLIKMNSKTTYSLLSEINSWKDHMLELKKLKITYLNCIMFLDYLFIGGMTINKQDMINLVVLDKSAETKKYIDSLPDEISRDVFTDAIFIEKIEDNDHDWIARIYFDEFMHERDTNPKVKEMTDNYLADLFSEIPTHTAQLNEFGEIETITPNKPPLRLV